MTYVRLGRFKPRLYEPVALRDEDTPSGQTLSELKARERRKIVRAALAGKPVLAQTDDPIVHAIALALGL